MTDVSLSRFASPNAKRNAFLSKGKLLNDKFKISLPPKYTPMERASRKALVTRMKEERSAGRWPVLFGDRLFIGKKGEPGEKKIVFDPVAKKLTEVPTDSASPPPAPLPLPRPPAESAPSTVHPRLGLPAESAPFIRAEAKRRLRRKGPISTGAKKTAINFRLIPYGGEDSAADSSEAEVPMDGEDDPTTRRSQEPPAKRPNRQPASVQPSVAGQMEKKETLCKARLKPGPKQSRMDAFVKRK